MQAVVYIEVTGGLGVGREALGTGVLVVVGVVEVGAKEVQI